RGESSDTSVAAIGSSPPRPIPATMRATSSASKEGASAESAAPPEKMTSVVVNIARRPYRSARRPETAAPTNMPSAAALGTSPADRVVHEDAVADAEDRVLLDPADHGGHAPLDVAVDERLGAIALFTHDDGPLRRGRQR